jgi:hypothetical protein
MLYEFSFTSTLKLVKNISKYSFSYILFYFSIPLTSYFLDCVPFIMNNSSSRVNGDSSQNKSNGRLVKAYSKFIQLMWTKPLNGRQKFVYLINL